MAKSNCVRVLVVIFNVIFVLIGLIILGLALWVYLDKNFEQYKGLNKNVFNIVLFVVMGIGGLTALIALCGCCGALYMSPCLLGVFFALLLVIFLVELAAAVLGFLMPGKVRESVNRSTGQLVNQANSRNPPNDNAWNALEATQTLLQCCGDARGAAAFPDDRFPPSCCALQTDNNLANKAARLTCTRASPTLNKSCPDKILEYFMKYRNYVLSALLGVAAIELFGMIFAMILCCSVRRYEEDGYVGVNT